MKTLSLLLRRAAVVSSLIALPLPAQDNSRKWDAVQSPASGRLNAVCYGNGAWLAFGSAAGEVYRSSDSINWEKIDGVTGLPAMQLPDMIYPRFVGDRFLYEVSIFSWKQSFDGKVWTDFPLPAGKDVTNITFGDDRWVCVGASYTAVATEPGDWTVTTLAAPTLRYVAWMDGQFLAFAAKSSGTDVFTSPDAITWTAHPHATEVWFDRLESGDVERSDGTVEHAVVGTLNGEFYYIGRGSAGDFTWETGKRDNVFGKLIHRRSFDAARPGHLRREWVNLDYCCNPTRLEGPKVYTLGKSSQPAVVEDRGSTGDFLATAFGPGAMVAVGTNGHIWRNSTGPLPPSTAVGRGNGYASEGVSSSPAMVGGRPAVAYSDDKYAAVKFVRATDATGTSWGTPVVVDGTGPVGRRVCMLTVSENPAVCYYDAARQRLKYARAIDANGSAWSPPVILETTNITPGGCAMEIVDGNPAICFADYHSLKFLRATDATGSAWGGVITVDNTGKFDRCSMKIVEGRPAIAYSGDGGLWYRRAADGSGTGWETRVNVSPSGSGPSMQVVNGRPAMSFLGISAAGSSALFFARAADATGSAWESPVTLDGGDSNPGSAASLAVVNGKPAIGYYASSPNLDLKYVQSTDDAGDAWDAPLTVDSTGDAGQFAVLLEVAAAPALFYHDDLEGSLRYLRATDATGGTRWPADIAVEAPAGNIVPDEGTKDLGIVSMGTVSTVVFTVRNPNSGSADLTVQGVTLDGPDAAEFAITSGPGVNTLAAGAATTFAVQYTPVTTGIKKVTLHVGSSVNGPRNPYEFTVTATTLPDMMVEGIRGRELTDGDAVNFSPLVPGQKMDVQFTIRNPGGGPLKNLAVTFDGPGSSDFLLLSPPAAEVPPRTGNGPLPGTTFTVRYAPLAAGHRSAMLRLANNLPGTRNPFDLTLAVEPGRADQAFAPFPGQRIDSLALHPDGRIVANVPLQGLSVFKPNGSPDTAFFPAAINNGLISCVAVQKDGNILIGGNFGAVEGREQWGLARLHADGSHDESLLFPGPMHFSVTTMAVQADGRILAGGFFPIAGGPPRFLARFLSDGNLDPEFQLVTEFGATLFPVSCIALQPDGKILLGGSFTATDEFPFNHLARLNAGGTADVSFTPAVSADVFSLAVQPDGKILAGAAETLLRLFPNGNVDYAVSVPGGALPSRPAVYDLALQADGRCLAAGAFRRIADTEISSLIRLNTDGTRDAAFNPFIFATGSSEPQRVALQPDGKVVIAGDFLGIDRDEAIKVLGRLHNDPAFTVLRAIGGSTVRWLRGGAAPEVRDVTFDVRPEHNPNWTRLGAGTRIDGGWELTGLTLPPSGEIRAQGYAGGSVMETVTSVQTAHLTILESWRFQFFGTTQNTGDAADDADSDHDGLTNFAEFAFGLSPVDRRSNALPLFVHTGAALTASFTPPFGSEGVLYRAEWSPAMLPDTWTEIPNAGTGGARVFSVPATGERIFVRFAVQMR
jgi:uncharacterized delta-60 repeat protein